MAFLVFLGSAVASVGCCAIDARRFPEAAAEHHRRQEQAGTVAFGALLTSVGAGLWAVWPRRRPRV